MRNGKNYSCKMSNKVSDVGMANASVQDGQSAPPPTAPPAVNKRPLASPSTAPGQESAKRNEVYISPEMGLLDRIRSGSGGNPG